jgi:phage/plasmid primase-like uncharacterized protein
MQESFTKPGRYIRCPACKKDDFRVDHLTEGTKAAWYCDGCGVRFRLHVLAENCVECDVIEDVEDDYSDPCGIFRLFASCRYEDK